MRNIALISLHTPTATNCRGASALPYHLIAFRPKDIHIEIWSYNLNACNKEQILESERKLGIKINIIERPKWFLLLYPAPVRLILSKPMLGYLPLSNNAYVAINKFLASDNSALWIYGEDIAHLASKFRGRSIVITTPDCEAMYYHRVLAMKGISVSKIAIAKYSLMYYRYARMAQNSPVGDNITYHLVGREDANFLKRLNSKANVQFIHHLHYDILQSPKEKRDLGNIKILIAGRYDFSMSRAVDEAIEAMILLPANVKEKYLVTFLGRGWEESAKQLRAAGFQVEEKGYVDDYALEVSLHDIQLTPIAVGTGTKGKVLDAFANGLMVIGTPLALENIAVTHGKECIEYTSGSELCEWLTYFAEYPVKISEIACAGRKAVLNVHSREKLANKFYSLFK